MSNSREFAIAPRFPRGGRPQEGPSLPEKEFRIKIRTLKKEMQEHQGELVLMVVRHWEKLGHDMPEERTPYGLDTNYYLGIIAPPYLKIKYNQIGIGTKEYVSSDKRRPHLGIKQGKGLIKDWQAWSWNLDRDSRSLLDRHGLKSNRKLVEIVVGDKAVTDWFLNEAQYGRMPDHIREFIEYPNENPELIQRDKKRYFDDGILILFQKMQAVLGKQVNLLPEDVQQRINAETERTKLKILENIEKLSSQEIQLTQRLASIRGIKLPRFTFPLDDPSYERQVREDEEDLRIIKSIPVTEERRRVQSEIQSEIRKAFELGLHKDPWIIVQEPTPGKRIEIDVPGLIRGYCQYYEIPIPQD